ncbi:MAG: hypothetical protein CMH57_08100 [Myxococcales bacterium]|nr:hypothetical protein [Myxococcales bacterium]
MKPELMDDDPVVDLRRSIEASRRQITDSFQDLREEVTERLDWKGWVREHPWEAVGTAFFVGFVIGSRPYL